MAAVGLRRRSRELHAREPGYIDAVLAEVAERGPLAPSDLHDPGAAGGPWWGWSKGKVALEHLFARGVLAIADRRSFARVYDLTERVIPADVLSAPTPSAEEADRELLVLAARCAGVATAADLADHFRIGIRVARPLIADLARTGHLTEVAVAGWDEPAYLHPHATVPRRVASRALLCPFDPLVWHRPRTERLFGMRYRIEIYTPAERRVHGYYVLPFLLGDRLVARVDLKADRGGGRLLVRSVHAEPGVLHEEVAGELHEALTALADWLGLVDVAVAERGDLAVALRRVERLK
jgi:uncharacterized protein YcaQ